MTFPLRHRRPSLRAAGAASLLALQLALSPGTAAGQATSPCAPQTATSASHDLYCFEMLPAGLGDSARGTAQLDWIPGPFTVAVTVEGTHRWNITLSLDGLPAALPPGAAPGYVAWAVPPALAPIQKLGVVRNGVSRVGPAAFDRFYVLVSAEPDTAADSRRGELVLRGESAANRLRPADNYEFFLGAIGVTPGSMQMAGHEHMARMADSLGWTSVPMPPGLQMLPSEMALRPRERAWLPAEDPAAPPARPREVRTLADGDTLDLAADVVQRTIAGRQYTMFGFNGQYPGPLLRVLQGGRITVRFSNHLPLPTTVHWHGLRLDNRFDGVPGLTQPAVPPGGTFVYQLNFPDAGIFWYHPHVREDIQQDLGLYGNLFVRPARADAYGPANREEFLVLDDLLVNDDGLVPYGEESPTHAATGRFGNLMLVNGESGWRGKARPGEVVRYFLTNVSNTRTFNLSFGAGARVKLVGSDVGTYAREEWVESVVIAPAERYVVDVRFAEPGQVVIVNRVRALDHLFGRFLDATDTLGVVQVAGAAARPELGKKFQKLRENTPGTAGTLALLREQIGRLPDHTLVLRGDMTDLPFVSSRLMRVDSIYFNPVEWAGTMPGMNWSTTGREAHWVLRDGDTGAENMDIQWRFRVGELVRLRLVNARDVLHGMQHPIHIHGQRFLLLAVNGIPNQNPVWKDTILVPAGSVVDLLVEMSNPGRWMVHCHIAEHLESGMMMTFDVEEH